MDCFTNLWMFWTFGRHLRRSRSIYTSCYHCHVNRCYYYIWSCSFVCEPLLCMFNLWYVYCFLLLFLLLNTFLLKRSMYAL
jgi:hypothetical protein